MNGVPTVAVTGAGGFLGGAIAEEFEREGWRVLRCGRQRSGVQPASRSFVTEELPADLLLEVLKQEQPAVCVHCAGGAEPRHSLEDPERDFVNGPQLTMWLLEGIRKHSPRTRVVFLSSAAVYGDSPILPIREDAPKHPLAPYGYSKLQSELVLECYRNVFGVESVALRIFSAYGPRLRKQVVWDLLNRIAAGGVLAVEGTGEESRDFIFGEDAARAVFHVSTLRQVEAVYNLATGVETTIAQLVDVLLRTLGETREVRFRSYSTTGLARNWRADISRLEQTGWRPVFSLAEGIRLTVERLKKD